MTYVALYAAGRRLMPPAFALLAPAVLVLMDTAPELWGIHPGWIALIAGAELATYPAYMLAYRSIAQVHGHPPIALPIVARVVVAGFGPFALVGGFDIDKQTLQALHEGRIYFEGSGAELLASNDAYLKEFLFMTLPPW